MEITNLSAFPHYDFANHKPYIASDKLAESILTANARVTKDQELMNIIYAPDSETGIPRSDIAILMANDKAPEVSQYIRDVLMQPHEQRVSHCGDDVDFALESTKMRGESFVEYGERLRIIAQKSFNS